jgi:hypothetical protein
MAKLLKCKVAQDGQTHGENAVYDAMFWHKKAKPQEDGSKLVTVGYDRLARQLRVGKNNVKKHCQRLITKLAMVKIAEPILAERVGTTYRVYNYPQILERRRVAGFTHYVNFKGASLLVDPTTRGQSDPGVNLASILNEVRHSATSVVNLTPVSVVNLTTGTRGQSDHAFSTREHSKKERTIVPVETASVSDGLLVAEQLPIRAASQEPPVEMLFADASSEAVSQLSKEGSEAGSLLSNREDHVQGSFPHTSKKEVPATVSLVGSPSIRGENPELVSSPRSWAGRQHNQPKATSKPLPSSARPLPLLAPAAPKAAAKPAQTNNKRDALDQQVLTGFAKLGIDNWSLVELGQAISPGQSEKGRAALCRHLADMRLRNLIALDGAGLYSVISVMVAPAPPKPTTEPVAAAVEEPAASEPAAKYPLPPPPAPLPFDVFDVVMTDYGYPRVVIPAPASWRPPVVDPDDWVGKPSANDEPHKPTVDYDDDDYFNTKGPGRPYVPATPAQHAPDLQATRDAEHDANMARINREMAEAEALEAQAAETMPAPTVEMNTELIGRLRSIMGPGVALPTNTLAELTGTDHLQVYDALRDMGAEVKNYTTYAGVSVWERRAA